LVWDEARRQVAESTVLELAAPEGYERWAASYDDVPNPLLAREERHLAPLLTDLRGKTVLDLACGTGRWLEKFITLGCATAIGIDSSNAMLQVAAQKTAICNRLAQGACENLPLPSAVFHLVTCSFALSHVQDLVCVVQELKRVTRIGADVFVSDLHPDAYARGWRVGFREGTTPLQIRVQMRSAEQIVHAFSANGFECQKHLALWLEEPEQPLFARAGKSELFKDACLLPAVLVCHFRRIESVVQ
jgi:ubiquinone/menaquinone biosynthesis C-methylase UbiE